jgi:hypothetical protein
MHIPGGVVESLAGLRPLGIRQRAHATGSRLAWESGDDKIEPSGNKPESRFL